MRGRARNLPWQPLRPALIASSDFYASDHEGPGDRFEPVPASPRAIALHPLDLARLQGFDAAPLSERHIELQTPERFVAGKCCWRASIFVEVRGRLRSLRTS